tara:strand:- start:70 stop:432 length:363 start_codon:yes stop_codon:yes gene_type:complete
MADRFPTAEERAMGKKPGEIKPIDEKLDDKIAKLNSTRVYKKVTPRYDLSWYIKWASSITLIIAMMFTAVDIYPINMWIANFGFVGWLIVGMLWHDRALIVLNAISLAIYSMGIINYYYG